MDETSAQSLTEVCQTFAVPTQRMKSPTHNRSQLSEIQDCFVSVIFSDLGTHGHHLGGSWLASANDPSPVLLSLCHHVCQVGNVHELTNARCKLTTLNNFTHTHIKNTVNHTPLILVSIFSSLWLRLNFINTSVQLYFAWLSTQHGKSTENNNKEN